MNKLLKIALVGFLLYPIFIMAQQKKAAKNTTQYTFSEMWIWEYKDGSGNKALMAIYREPVLNYWLLTPDDAGFRSTDEMSLWFILKPDGEVLQAFQEEGKSRNKKLVRHRLFPEKKTRLPGYWRGTGKTRYFGDTFSGFPEMKGMEYEVSYEKTNDKTAFFLAKAKVDGCMLSLFNDLDIDAKLPIRFPKDIPGDFIPLSEYTVFPAGSVQYGFKYISHTEYNIDLSEYMEVW
ncbi:MAG: hypothetical protein JNM21_17250 [Taibaiella sp.]|nr:hypothetical protein [Taibaiella sp.]